MSLDEAAAFALSLPEAVEAPHFDFRSWRVGGRIFATAPPDGGYLHVFLDEHAVRAYVAEAPAACEVLEWGRRVVGVRVRLAAAGRDLVCELLREAWTRRAPRRLRAAGPAAG